MMTTEGNSAAAFEMEDLLRRLDASREALMDALDSCDPDSFAKTNGEGEPIKEMLERTSDELNFHYGSLLAQALNLPQPPCTQKAEFLSLREAKMSLQVTHRRFTNLLHDLVPADMARTATDGEQGGTYTAQQLIEMAAAQYRLRAQQVQHLGTEQAGRAR